MAESGEKRKKATAATPREAYVSAMASDDAKTIASHIFKRCLESMCLEANDHPIKFFNENETGARIGGVGVRTGNALATVALDTPRGDDCIVEIHVHRVLPIVTYGCGRGYDCGGGHGCEAFQRRGRDCDACAAIRLMTV